MHGVAFFGRAFVEGLVVGMVAEEFIGTIVAVFDAIAALLVGHDLAARADKSMIETGSSDVMADVSGLGCGNEGHEDEQYGGSSHIEGC